MEAELLRREAPPSYGQLIAQGLIPPVEDFPVCSGSQASVLENLRLAVRSQLGFTSIRLPSSGRHGNLWRRLFTLSRSRRSGSLALVSADLDDGAGSGSTGSSASELLSPDSDDTDTEGERGRERGVGAVGGSVAPLPPKAPPSCVVEPLVSVTSSSSPLTARDRPREALPPASPIAVVTASPEVENGRPAVELRPLPTGTLQRLAQNLHRLARNLSRTSQNHQDQTWNNHSPLRQLETGRGGAEAGERGGSRDEDEDVELLVPGSDSDAGDVRHLLLEPQACPAAGHAPRLTYGSGCRGDGPCEHCGMVHTAQIPDACLEATGKTESSDDELLLLC